jgi:hypothetical protein
MRPVLDKIIPLPAQQVVDFIIRMKMIIGHGVVAGSANVLDKEGFQEPLFLSCTVSEYYTIFALDMDKKCKVLSSLSNN